MTQISGPGMGKIIFSFSGILSLSVWLVDGFPTAERPIETILRIFIPLAIWMFNDFLVIDMSKKRVVEGYSFFWIRLFPSRIRDFSGLEKIFINEVEGYWAGSKPSYKAFLKTKEGDKFEIAVAKSKERVMAKASAINAVLQTEIVDNTGMLAT